MTESFVTQCPHCNTRFRVARSQLRAARGAVRCGSCLQVFNAAKQLQEQGLYTPDPVQPVSTPAPAPVVASTPQEQPEEETLWIHDDLDLEHLDLDEELARLEHEQSQHHTASPKASSPEVEPAHDERWAEELLAAEQAASQQQAQAARASSDDEELRRPRSNYQPLTLIERTEPKLGSVETYSAPDEVESHELDNAQDDQPPALGLNASRNEEIDDEPVYASFGTPEKDPNLSLAQNDKRLVELDDEPLNLDYQERKKGGAMRLLWTLLALLAALALGGQYVAYHFDEMARQDQYRPWFEKACPIVGCELPSKVDISQIKSSNLVVRSHPDFSGALVVDAIIYNRASFTQPFPLLEMRFADINGKLLASRRFKPSEYLAGELAGKTEMPSQTPIHIALDILDPGSKAVNYSLSFHSPE